MRWLSTMCVLVVGSVVTGACDNSSRTPPRADPPMKPTPADGPFTTAQLLDIAYDYHPRMEHLKFESSQHRRSYEARTPEWRARLAAHEQAMAERGPWRDLVRELDAALPDHDIIDRTPWHKIEPAYVVEIAAKEQFDSEVRGMVSALAPVYFIFETTNLRQPRDPCSPAAEPVIAALERAILDRYPYHRVDVQTGLTPVPGIAAGNQWYGTTTLIDALFASGW